MAEDTAFEQATASELRQRGGMPGVRKRTGKVDRIQSSIWLEPSDHDHLRAMAKAECITMAEAIEKMVRTEWQRREKKMQRDIGITPQIDVPEQAA